MADLVAGAARLAMEGGRRESGWYKTHLSDRATGVASLATRSLRSSGDQSGTRAGAAGPTRSFLSSGASRRAASRPCPAAGRTRCASAPECPSAFFCPSCGLLGLLGLGLLLAQWASPGLYDNLRVPSPTRGTLPSQAQCVRAGFSLFLTRVRWVTPGQPLDRPTSRFSALSLLFLFYVGCLAPLRAWHRPAVLRSPRLHFQRGVGACHTQYARTPDGRLRNLQPEPRRARSWSRSQVR